MHDVRWQGQGSTHENSLSLLAQPHASKLLRRLRSHSLRSEAALKVFVGVLPCPCRNSRHTKHSWLATLAYPVLLWLFPVTA